MINLLNVVLEQEVAEDANRMKAGSISSTGIISYLTSKSICNSNSSLFSTPKSILNNNGDFFCIHICFFYELLSFV